MQNSVHGSSRRIYRQWGFSIKRTPKGGVAYERIDYAHEIADTAKYVMHANNSYLPGWRVGNPQSFQTGTQQRFRCLHCQHRLVFHRHHHRDCQSYRFWKNVAATLSSALI